MKKNTSTGPRSRRSETRWREGTVQDFLGLSDAEAALLAEEVSRRVEGELEYPGQIKVMVIRETRSTAYAR